MRFARLLAVIVAATDAWSIAGAADQTAQTKRTLTISPATPVAVEATIGSIAIVGWDRPTIEVEIVRRAPSTAELEKIVVSIDDGPAALRISALQADSGRDRRLTSTIAISAPLSTIFESVRLLDGPIGLSKLGGAVDAKTDHGDLDASELSGAVRLETTLGNLSLTKARATADGMIHLRAFDGTVHLGLAETPADARILAITFNGQISSDIPLRTKDRFGVRFAETTLGRGEPVISIDVVTGDIQIKTGR